MRSVLLPVRRTFLTFIVVFFILFVNVIEERCIVMKIAVSFIPGPLNNISSLGSRDLYPEGRKANELGRIVSISFRNFLRALA